MYALENIEETKRVASCHQTFQKIIEIIIKAGHGFLSATVLLYCCACKQQTTAKIYKLSHVMFTAGLAQLELL
jgi:hypothetical protein